MLKIWGRTNSINVQKVLWCCGELNIEYERIDAGLQFGVIITQRLGPLPRLACQKARMTTLVARTR